MIRAVRELYADTPVAEFGPLALKAARQRWVNDGRSRTECNRRVGMIKRIFKWGVSEELAPPEVYLFGTPEVPVAPVRIYLDIEGLPDEGFVYLIGMTVVEGGAERISFWADAQDAGAGDLRAVPGRGGPARRRPWCSATAATSGPS